MEIKLVKAKESDAKSIFNLQVAAFQPLLEKYQDYDTSPANESVEKVASRIIRPDSEFFKIFVDGEFCGAIRVHWKEESQFWISPLFIHPDFQGRGIAQEAMKLAEDSFPQADTWELATLLEEEGNCYLYEKAGYVRTGVSRKLNSKATLVYFKKMQKEVE
ncbi:GNAT family N-acetyltransferase [Planococcus shenhongbingii]|uniref:GNAT family N-acetyltransferase n=1 Tax=Planococcus shenhongbingii TaxID=3058398 RepID=A0ABT8NBW3_9BACL|nr:GNAT family N-acetyltransferase [Planococcus sp. N017]MDN7245346.1 GNAT family N-acetyltransferase [Planococcus sp. N017]